MAALHGSGVELFDSSAARTSGVSSVSAAYSEDDRDKKLQSASLEASEVAAGIADASSNSISSSSERSEGKSLSKSAASDASKDKSAADDSIVVPDQSESDAAVSESVLSVLERSLSEESSASNLSGVERDSSSVRESIEAARVAIAERKAHVPKALRNPDEVLKEGKVVRKKDTIVVHEANERLYEERLHFLRNNGAVAPRLIDADRRQRVITTANLAAEGFYDLDVQEIAQNADRNVQVAFLNGLAAMYRRLDGNYQDILVPGNYAVRRNEDGTIDVRMYEAGRFLGRVGTQEDTAAVMMSQFLGYFCSRGNGGKRLLGGRGSRWYKLYANTL